MSAAIQHKQLAGSTCVQNIQSAGYGMDQPMPMGEDTHSQSMLAGVLLSNTVKHQIICCPCQIETFMNQSSDIPDHSHIDPETSETSTAGSIGDLIRIVGALQPIWKQTIASNGKITVAFHWG